MSVECLPRVPPPARPDPVRERREGVRAMASILLAFAPFAVAVGTAITHSDNRLAAWLGTSTVYGGAAHLAVLDLLADGAGWVAAAAVALLVNVRLAAFATSMVPEWRSEPVRRRLVAAVMLTDGPWAMSRNRPGQRDFYLGAAATLFLAWPVMVSIGMLLGEWLSAWAVTAILPPLSLAALVAPRLRVRPVVVAAAAAVVTALLTLDLPAGTSMVICAVVGTVAAAVTKSLTSAPEAGSPS